MVEGALITAGIMISYWLDFGFFFAKGSVNWRFPIAFQIVFAIVIVCFVLVSIHSFCSTYYNSDFLTFQQSLPDSPRWLIKKDRVEEARLIFSALDDVEPDHHLITAQIEEIVATLIDEERSNAPIRRLFTFGREKHFHRAMLGFWNQAAQQLTGINLVGIMREEV
ncbi:glucose-inactivated glycerol proton symporter STL1 [Sugiyamaella lignohabitans]|uniref:Glucose-inactivated glycerol proton symporter STL1 n=1 Tax=Sugiyamaella lignohabitans TaxID=796027 RepID=A0A167F1C8_9ASCO|nr:glucose-inactivated glycerol proton symporter STL1 [Sugiyamaella lignohabitans]ANB14701.1 glucose-inactivated glycerol proton symporter STL1 [Sugiyamaella lignohabitans]